MSKNTTRKHKPSSGLKHQRIARRLAHRLEMKIKRWKKYQEKAPDNTLGQIESEKAKWDTSGLEKALAHHREVENSPSKMT